MDKPANVYGEQLFGETELKKPQYCFIFFQIRNTLQIFSPKYVYTLTDELFTGQMKKPIQWAKQHLEAAGGSQPAI